MSDDFIFFKTVVIDEGRKDGWTNGVSGSYFSPLACALALGAIRKICCYASACLFRFFFSVNVLIEKQHQ